MTNELEDEIKVSTDRIKDRSSFIESKITSLDRKIKIYTNWAWIFVFAGIAIAVFGVLLFFCTENGKFTLNLLGDFYGGTVASIWSLAGLFLIYVAFLGQKQQLLNQQLEIMYSQLEVKYTRLELEGQKKELIEQNRTLRQQRFENTFFQLLRNHQDIVNAIDIRKHAGGTWTVSSQGRDCFKTFYSQFKNRIGNTPESSQIAITKKCYMEFYEEHQSDLGHYFRHLYHILKYIENATEIEEKQKFKYSSLIRALLSSYELALLYYNGIGKYGVEYFKPLIEKFSFLKNLDTKLILNDQHLDEYDKIAFYSSKQRKLLLPKE